jgi:hypothetical protein
LLPRRSFLATPLLLLTPLAGAQSPAPNPVLEDVRLSRSDEGLRLAYSARLELPRPVDDALHKGVALYFVAEAVLTRERWYWRDATVARMQRQWRLSYQPLSRKYRLSTGGLHQGYDTLGEALALVGRASGWPLELREELQPDSRYALRFSLRLDTAQLPAPLQIGLGAGASLNLFRELRLSASELQAAS